MFSLLKLIVISAFGNTSRSMLMVFQQFDTVLLRMATAIFDKTLGNFLYSLFPNNLNVLHPVVHTLFPNAEVTHTLLETM
jgi:hypothetical protein